MRRLLAAWIVALAAPAAAAPVRGLVYDDQNGNGRPGAGEPGVASAVVAFGVEQFVVTSLAGLLVPALAAFAAARRRRA